MNRPSSFTKKTIANSLVVSRDLPVWLILTVVVAVLSMSRSVEAVTMLGHYRFDSVAGTTTPDETGNATGNLIGGVDVPTVSGTAKIGSSLNFTGLSSQAVTFTDPSRGRNAFTASAWFRPSAAGSQGIIGNWGDNTILLRTTAGGIIQTYANADGVAQIGGSVTGLGAVSTSSFNHVALTYDGQTLRAVLNGVAATNSYSFAGAEPLGQSGTNPLAIGGRGGSEGVFTGLVDDLAFFESVLDNGRINALINLADEPSLNYDAGQVNSLFEVFDLEVPSVQIGDLTWVPGTGLGGSAGDVIDLGPDEFFLNIDGTAGVHGFVLQVPEPSSALLVGLGALGLVRRTRRRRKS